MGDDDGERLPPIERLVRRHIKALDEFVRRVYPSVAADPVIYAVFERAQRRLPTGDEIAVRIWLFGEARAFVRRQNRSAWPEHNARVVRDELRAQGEVMTDWHAWSELNRLIDGLERLTVAQQEVVRLITLYDEIGPRELAVVLRLDERAAADLLDEATTALRAVFDDGDPTSQVEGVER